MTAQQVRTKEELLAALRSNEQDVVEKLSGLPEDEFDKGRYESGWNGRQILAHIASIEWTYPRLIDRAREGASPPGGRSGGSSAGGGGINDYNQRQVERRAQATVPELLAEFRGNRAATIAAVEAADEELMTAIVRSAGGFQGPLATVLYALAALHTLGHVNDIVGR